jgi:hypothetical protein
MRLLALVAAGLLLIGLPGAYGRSGSDPGITPDTILLGATVPLSGDEIAYSAVARGSDAYFQYVNDHGGVRGRKIRYLYVDDAYNPRRRSARRASSSRTTRSSRSSAASAPSTRSRPAVPEPARTCRSSSSAAGSRRWRSSASSTSGRWAILPRFAGEGALYGRYVSAHTAEGEIAVLTRTRSTARTCSRASRRARLALVADHGASDVPALGHRPERADRDGSRRRRRTRS